MEQIIQRIKKWNKLKEIEEQMIDEEINRCQQRIKGLETKEMTIAKKKMEAQRLHQKLMKAYERKHELSFEKIYSYDEAVNLQTFFQECREEILEEEDYRAATKCYKKLKKLREKLQWIQEKENNLFTSKEIELTNRIFHAFNEALLVEIDFPLFGRCSNMQIPKQNNFGEQTIQKYEHYGQILQDSLQKSLSYAQYFDAVTLLYNARKNEERLVKTKS